MIILALLLPYWDCVCVVTYTDASGTHTDAFETVTQKPWELEGCRCWL